MASFEVGPYLREGISKQDVKHIRHAFDSLRDENDIGNEVKISKLKQLPIFTRQDIARLISGD